MTEKINRISWVIGLTLLCLCGCSYEAIDMGTIIMSEREIIHGGKGGASMYTRITLEGGSEWHVYGAAMVYPNKSTFYIQKTIMDDVGAWGFIDTTGYHIPMWYKQKVRRVLRNARNNK